jgi:two-component system phosphate regulon sensor histidine kinase PhoR
MGMENNRNIPALQDVSLLSNPEIYAVIVNNLPIGFSLVDRNGIIIEFNPAAEKLTGYSKEEVINKSHFEIIHGSKNPDSCPLSNQVFEKHIPSIAAETLLKRKDGETVTLLVVAFPIFDVSGNFIGGAELFRDISAVKRLEREHKNLLSMFAHDMKNPVVAAGGLLTRLLSGKAGPLAEKQRNYLAIVMQAIAILQRLISDFLDFSRLERKEYKPITGPYNLEEAIYGQIEMLKVTAEKKKIQIYFEYTQEDLPVVCADGSMIDRALSNLIENAIKYNNPGGTVMIRLTGRDKNILVEVSDTGIGIHERDMPCVFDAFCRLNRGIEGTGLGLSIAKAIIEAHHGIISVESTPGKGSRFWFTLPENLH